MHGASASSSPDIICLLHKHQLDVKARNTNGLTPLHEASQAKSGNVAVLLKLSADLTRRKKSASTPSTVAMAVWTNTYHEDPRRSEQRQHPSKAIPRQFYTFRLLLQKSSHVQI